MRIAIAASGKLGVSVMLPLLHSRHQVVALLQDGRVSRGWSRTFWKFAVPVLGGRDSILRLARARRIPVHYIDKMDEAELAPLRKLDIDLLLVSGFAIILKPPLLELPNLGCVNMHSSLLPRHRGPNPFAAVIRAGEAETGITFHIMEPGIDTGPILEQVRFPIDERDEMLNIYLTACQVAGETVTELMDRIEAEGLIGIPQDESLATYDPKPREEDAWIDWTQSAVEIDRLVRALTPSKMARFKFRGKPVFIAKSQPEPWQGDAAPGTVLQASRPVRVATGDGALSLGLALSQKPVPWVWPSPFSQPEVGEQLQ